MRKIVDLSGKVFGRLTVISFSHLKGNSYWHCRCSCGNEKIIKGRSMITGLTTSCGCYCLEVHTKHGHAGTKEYKTWHGMLARCYNPEDVGFLNYGARGISVCDRWLNSFELFLSDMGLAPSKLHSIDRIDFNGNYEPSNCRWATWEEQNNNRRNNLMVTHEGKTLSMSQWCRLLNVSISVAHRRLRKNLPFDECFIPKRK